MNLEIVPGLFLEVTADEEQFSRSRFVEYLPDTNLPPSLASALEHFLEQWRRGIHAPLDDALFRFPATHTKWRMLFLHLKNEVPLGMTITYTVLGLPFKIHPRVVGRIMAQNPFPLLIPCHRVIGSNGHLTGFSAAGGLKTKEKLLLCEKKRGKSLRTEIS